MNVLQIRELRRELTQNARLNLLAYNAARNLAEEDDTYV